MLALMSLYRAPLTSLSIQVSGTSMLETKIAHMSKEIVSLPSTL